MNPIMIQRVLVFLVISGCAVSNSCNTHFAAKRVQHVLDSQNMLRRTAVIRIMHDQVLALDTQSYMITNCDNEDSSLDSDVLFQNLYSNNIDENTHLVTYNIEANNRREIQMIAITVDDLSKLPSNYLYVIFEGGSVDIVDGSSLRDPLDYFSSKKRVVNQVTMEVFGIIDAQRILSQNMNISVSNNNEGIFIGRLVNSSNHAVLILCRMRYIDGAIHQFENDLSVDSNRDCILDLLKYMKELSAPVNQPK